MYVLASKVLACGNGGIQLGCPYRFAGLGGIVLGYRFLGCPISSCSGLTSLDSLNNYPYYCTITVSLTPDHMGSMLVWGMVLQPFSDSETARSVWERFWEFLSTWSFLTWDMLGFCQHCGVFLQKPEHKNREARR